MKKEKTIKDYIFDFAYHAAVNDATMQKAYGKEKRIIEENEKAKAIVRKYIDQLMDHQSPSFMSCALQVNEAVSDNEFSFGNIQKLINMTAKYLFISCYANESFRECFVSCDCPMDRSMISKVRKIYRDKKGIPSNQPIPGIDDLIEAKWADVSWSNLSFEKTQDTKSIQFYEMFQKMVKELADLDSISPIEYDFKVWDPTTKDNE